MVERPAYRVDLVPGQRYFQCSKLHAQLSTKACTENWRVAKHGATCFGCELGSMHHADHNPVASAQAHRRATGSQTGTACVRCGRTDLRIIAEVGLCISDFNRTREVERGRNGRGTKPIKLRLWDAEVAIQHVGGRVERRLVPVQHMAEALARVLRDLPDSARLMTSERRLTEWNGKTKEFEHVCERCGAQGQLLERRMRDGVLQRHAWCCDGEPKGAGWELAKVRRPVMTLSPSAVAVVLDGDPDLADEQPGTWTPTGIACECGAGQVEGWLTRPGGNWRARCEACGAEGG